MHITPLFLAINLKKSEDTSDDMSDVKAILDVIRTTALEFQYRFLLKTDGVRLKSKLVPCSRRGGEKQAVFLVTVCI